MQESSNVFAEIISDFRGLATTASGNAKSQDPNAFKDLRDYAEGIICIFQGEPLKTVIDTESPVPEMIFERNWNARLSGIDTNDLIATTERLIASCDSWHPIQSTRPKDQRPPILFEGSAPNSGTRSDHISDIENYDAEVEIEKMLREKVSDALAILLNELEFKRQVELPPDRTLSESNTKWVTAGILQFNEPLSLVRLNSDKSKKCKIDSCYLWETLMQMAKKGEFYTSKLEFEELYAQKGWGITTHGKRRTQLTPHLNKLGIKIENKVREGWRITTDE